MLAGCLSFFFKKSSYFIFKNNTQHQSVNNTVTIHLDKHVHDLTLKLKLSFAAFGSCLLDISCYEIQQINKTAKVICHAWSINTSRHLTLTWSSTKSCISIESLYFNAKWLEREAAEMSGWFFLKKRDRRVLFLIPVLFNAPLNKTYPVGGFFDLLLCPLTNKLTFKHQSWLS